MPFIAIVVRGSAGLVFDFHLKLVDKREPEYSRLMASGDFVGIGIWKLKEEQGKTAVTYEWNVAVTRWLPRLLSYLPGARRYMERSHERVMERGGENLAALLRT